MFTFLQSKPIIVLSSIGAVAGITCFTKDMMQGGEFKSKVRADDKVIIVTGSNTGIGKETVRELAKRGAHVYMACRDLKRCEEARQEIVLESKNKYVYCRECDLASFDSIRKFVQQFKSEQNKLDVLINNAGVMRCPKTLTADGIELQIGVNHMGHFLLTNLLLDLLKKSAPSRIVNVSSLAHTRGKINVDDLNSEQKYDEGDAYNQSKLANVLFTKELAQRLAKDNVTVNALHPGVVDTDIFRHMGFVNSYFAAVFVKPIMWVVVKNPRSGAQTTLHVALHPKLSNVTGKYFSDCKEKEVAEQGKDEQTSKWLWAVSEKWTKLNA